MKKTHGQALAVALETNATMTELDLEMTGLGLVGVQAPGKIWSEGKTNLQHLSPFLDSFCLGEAKTQSSGQSFVYFQIQIPKNPSTPQNWLRIEAHYTPASSWLKSPSIGALHDVFLLESRENSDGVSMVRNVMVRSSLIFFGLLRVCRYVR